MEEVAFFSPKPTELNFNAEEEQEELSHSTSEVPESSKDTQDKDKLASFTREDGEHSTSADGLARWLVQEESELSEEDPEDALSTKREPLRKLSAGTSEEELSENSWEMVEDAQSTREDGVTTSDAQEEPSEPGDGEDSTSREQRSSRDSPDKDKLALFTLEDITDSSDADGPANLEEQE